MKELISIFISFFKMGSVTFGGGYAMLPILRKECVEKNKWITEEQVMDYYAVSQGLPGIIAVNVSVFIGYRRRKFAGGIGRCPRLRLPLYYHNQHHCRFSFQFSG